MSTKKQPLRPYQKEALRRIKNARQPFVIRMPSGMGKSGLVPPPKR